MKTQLAVIHDTANSKPFVPDDGSARPDNDPYSTAAALKDAYGC